MPLRTEACFREDAYQMTCDAQVLGVREDRQVILDRTVFYYTSGGQPGDTGLLKGTSGVFRVLGTELIDGEIRHFIHDDDPVPSEGDSVVADIDWPRRYTLMRMHTALHTAMAVVPFKINGCQIAEQKSRIDFDPEGGKLDRTEIEAKMNALVEADLPISVSWRDASVLDEEPGLIRTMATEPPRGDGQMRFVSIGGAVDVQPCGGTHIRSLKELGTVRIGKIDNKGAHNKRVTVSLEG